MKLAFQLAYKNLVGAGLKTWLTVGVLAFTFLLMIFYNGMMEGWNYEAVRSAIQWEYGQGQYHSDKYNAKDPFSILGASQSIPPNIDRSTTAAILLRQATVRDQGRMQSILVKGIDQDQTILKIPSHQLIGNSNNITAVMGNKMAQQLNVVVGDTLLLSFGAGLFSKSHPIEIREIFQTNTLSADMGQIYIGLNELQKLSGLQDEATILVSSAKNPMEYEGWNYRSKEELLSGLYAILQSKRAGGSIMYLMLLAMSLLAIFDTQVLSIFRRQKEIGTYISLGMTRWQVVKLFTFEGTMFSILAALAATVIGIPLFWFLSQNGIPLPEASVQGNMGISNIIYPRYTIPLIATTLILVFIAATIVSYLPSRKIAKMDPIQALKGKIQ